MSFLSCFHLSKTSDDCPPHPPLRPQHFLTTQTSYTYQTAAGTVTVTWSQSIFGRSLQLHLHNHHPFNPPTFNLRINAFPFSFRNKKRGHKSLSHNIRIFWNLSKARFGNRPEPESNYLLALTLDDSIALLVGDVPLKDACATCKARDPKNRQVLVTRKEYVDVHANGVSNRIYSTSATIAGRTRELEVEYHGGGGDDSENSRLLFSFDGEKVLEVKRLRWKFRGNERVEIGEGGHVQITWDVHNWLFKKEEYQHYYNNYNNSYNNKNNNLGKSDDGHAVFMFKFEEDEDFGETYWNDSECGKTGKSLLLSSSSFSMSSSLGSFGGSSSVMEWSNLEESELIGPVGLTLLVHAWRIGI
ncbi:hypothetical protein HN51_042045 [Arachis hypogaea]|uniref:DUF868 domain-containing protein n=1 Tax=Arachis hypogaea TaxID=3818 RepID=A0A444YV63_ARAHY|nr:uncharacterized protein LOC112697542 [Arachis hypogaea]QHN87896.1 DUF868 family protein [Arachis hypogaea]RYR05831.1 hypothetical protein Ahy_B06g085653 isoform A [Arachis hypogaea]RYR05832.1 hypothetical protein Ahy_B06g085653 isoform B [Arachis hypogaea]